MSATTIGLLGGSFNPAHDGHRAMSFYALEHLKLDQIWWLVSPQNPLKLTEGMASLADRLAQAHEVANDPRILVTDLERELGTCYTIDTLRALKDQFPAAKFVWLMGEDNLAQMSLWKDWQGIFRIVPVAVFRRKPYGTAAMHSEAVQTFAAARIGIDQAGDLALKAPPVWLLCENEDNPLSATALRGA